jgi:seryl-tRNA synthetase
MIEINVIRSQAVEVIERLKVKNFDAAAVVERILEVDTQRRKTQKILDDTLAESNQLARDIGALFKAGKREEADAMKERTAVLKQQAKSLQEELESLSAEQDNLLVQLPNLPHVSVPKGKMPEDNEIVNAEGEMPVLSSDALPHWDLAKKYDLIDFECGTRITGAGFPVYKGKGARLAKSTYWFLPR